jgi:hypothetical protein
MVAYEYYWRDPKTPIKGYQLIGVLPERRKIDKRITKDSVINWVEKYFCKNLNMNDMFFIQVSIDRNTGRIFRPNPVFITKKEI